MNTETSAPAGVAVDAVVRPLVAVSCADPTELFAVCDAWMAAGYSVIPVGAYPPHQPGVRVLCNSLGVAFMTDRYPPRMRMKVAA